MLDDIVKELRPDVMDGLNPGAKDGWTQAQYVKAVRMIVAAPANAVTAAELEDELGKGDAGKEALQAMVRANLLSYRPFSNWAQDIDRSAFKNKLPVVTAPTAAHLVCMQELELPAPSDDTVRC